VKVFLEIHNTISNIGSNHYNKNSNSLQGGKITYQDTNQTSRQSVQTRNANTNATGAFTMVEQIMTELSDAVKKKEKTEGV
jgi:hypothetical protein